MLLFQMNDLFFATRHDLLIDRVMKLMIMIDINLINRSPEPRPDGRNPGDLVSQKNLILFGS